MVPGRYFFFEIESAPSIDTEKSYIGIETRDRKERDAYQG